jgi:peptidoglycan hydrolase-like protein with peptidoglycan-binding domain
MNRSIVAALLLYSVFVLISAFPTAAMAQTRSKTAAPAKSASKTQNSSRNFRYGQRSPSRQRMKQIQLALKERGYDPGPIDGDWGSKSSSALKRFEKDHDLPADGGLDSLALITLGLGPKPPTNTASANQPSTQGN